MSDRDATQDGQPMGSGHARRTLQPPLAVIQLSSNLKEHPVPVATARYVQPWLAHLVTGYTVKAIERKIERGDWVEGKVWIRAPDGRILIDIVGYQKWVEGR